MEFDRSRTRWTHIALYLLYVAGVVYLLMSNNQYLYSHRELRLALAGEKIDTVTPVPKGEKPAAGKGEALSWTYGSPERNGQEPGTQTHDTSFVTEWNKAVVQESADGDVTEWSADESGVYLTGQGPWATALSPEGEIRWRFRFTPTKTESGMLEPILDKQSVYFARPSGQMVAINKNTGALEWKLNLATEILSSPILVDNELWVVMKPLETEQKRLEDAAAQEGKPSTSKKAAAPIAPYRFARVNRNTGELGEYSNPFNINGRVQLTWARDAKQLLATNDNKLFALSLDDGKSITIQTLPDPIKGPAAVAEGKAFVALASGKIQAWDLSKKGKFEWEVDLESPPHGPPTYIPQYQRLSVLTTDGHLNMIDIKKAERLWRFQPENRNLNHGILATRLGGRFIEKLGMKWERKGWTIWTPCSENRLCIYNPDKGQLLARVPAPASVLSLPLFVGKDFYLLTSERKGEKRGVSLARYMEEDTFKQKQKAAAAADPAVNK